MAAQEPASNVADKKKNTASGISGRPGTEPPSAGELITVPPTDEHVIKAAGVDRPPVSEAAFVKSYVGGSVAIEPLFISGPTTDAPPFRMPQSTQRPEKDFDLMCLCLATILGFFVLAFFFIVSRYFYPAATVAGLRSCGDVVVWGVGSMKGGHRKILDHANFLPMETNTGRVDEVSEHKRYETCTEGECRASLCGPTVELACEAEVPWFDNKCECCDWCLRKTLACQRKNQDRGLFTYCHKMCRNL
ncbi:uncharacterized protein [Dermacentor albipictus]|uniref:uncharacterized protein isoform X2 n=1 Tax=Dermacentor albipictus TaxID=60249 RepID=UPI0038FC86E1